MVGEILPKSVLCALLELDSKDTHIIKIKEFWCTDVAEVRPTATYGKP